MEFPTGHRDEIAATRRLGLRGHPSQSATEEWLMDFFDDHPDRSKVNLVLTPDVEVAARTVDIDEICGETLRFDDVSVDPHPPPSPMEIYFEP